MTPEQLACALMCQNATLYRCERSRDPRHKSSLTLLSWAGRFSIGTRLLFSNGFKNIFLSNVTAIYSQRQKKSCKSNMSSLQVAQKTPPPFRGFYSISEIFRWSLFRVTLVTV